MLQISFLCKENLYKMIYSWSIKLHNSIIDYYFFIYFSINISCYNISNMFMQPKKYLNATNVIMPMPHNMVWMVIRNTTIQLKMTWKCVIFVVTKIQVNIMSINIFNRFMRGKEITLAIFVGIDLFQNIEWKCMFDQFIWVRTSLEMDGTLKLPLALWGGTEKDTSYKN